MKTPRKRATQSETDQRIMKIEHLLLHAIPVSRIVDMISQTENLSKRQVFRLLESARKNLNANNSVQEELGMLSRRYELFLQQAWSKKDTKLVIQTLNQQAKLIPTLHKFGGNVNAPASNTGISAGMEAALRALATKSKTE